MVQTGFGTEKGVLIGEQPDVTELSYMGSYTWQQQRDTKATGSTGKWRRTPRFLIDAWCRFSRHACIPATMHPFSTKGERAISRREPSFKFKEQTEKGPNGKTQRERRKVQHGQGQKAAKGCCTPAYILPNCMEAVWEAVC